MEDRFWRKVEKTDGCWEWTGSVNHKGYGRFQVGRRLLPAHRVAYELIVGPIPDGLHIDHLCRNRACVNPDHMEPVPQAENTARGEGITAANTAKTHCSHGHEFDAANTYFWRGKRNCRTCRHLREQKRKLTRVRQGQT